MLSQQSVLKPVPALFMNPGIESRAMQHRPEEQRLSAAGEELGDEVFLLSLPRPLLL